MARRLRIKLEIIDKTGSMTMELGRHPSEPGIGREPTEKEFRLAYACNALLCGLGLNDEYRAIVEKAMKGE